MWKSGISEQGICRISKYNTLWLIYPERRSISEEEVCTWAKDSWYNNAVRYKCTECGTVTVAEHWGKPVDKIRPGEYSASDPNNPCTCTNSVFEPVYEDGLEPPSTLEECVEFLEDLGEATFSHPLYN